MAILSIPLAKRWTRMRLPVNKYAVACNVGGRRAGFDGLERETACRKEALQYIYELEDEVLNSKDEGLISDWRKLQTSDHFYYMGTKNFTDGDVHAYFSPYDSPYDAFLYYMNTIRDMNLD